MICFIGVCSDGVKVQRDSEVLGIYTSVDDWKARSGLSDDDVIMFKSSIDWPEDETSDNDIIHLADMLRGNNVSGLNPEFHILGPGPSFDLCKHGD